ncbi:acyl-CoA (8-3)-desaturase-like [Chelonia mydas]|uniref:acyl-CoA (8-3)-desaturase-like n=1 Tax=Chelonia mydas TaxID=8469 RepID=UPI001CA87BE9|nr:acyl-CoA (8-3)-desaturase-like [Chelonia mydas]XP_043406163.1 acyl-CoA (8-3)-desaturase-like [Chelonia mydas]
MLKEHLFVRLSHHKDAFVAFHINKTLVRKSMNMLLTGELAPGQPSFEPCKNFQGWWFQHDLGHLSVITKSKWNHLCHEFMMCKLKGPGRYCSSLGIAQKPHPNEH